MRRLRIATCLQEMESLRPLWEALEHAPGTTIFQTYRWNLAAARHFAGRERPHIIALESDRGAVIVPGAVSEAHTSFLGEMLFDYRDVLAAGDSDLIADAVGELVREGRDFWLPAVRECATFAIGLRQAWVGAPMLRRSRTSPEEFLRQHFRARKQLRRLLKAGSSFACYDGRATAMLEWLYRQKAVQFADSGCDIFSDAARRACMLEICGASGANCEIFAIELGSSIVGALVTFLERDVRRLYTIWHDPAREDLSPGIALLLHVAHRSLQQGLDVDLLTGEQPHKTRFSNDRVQLYRVRATADQLLRREAALLAA